MEIPEGHICCGSAGTYNILQTEIAKGSGRGVLDQRAIAIVQGASPFDNFTAEMKRQADQLVVVTRFNFARDETLQTQMVLPP